MPNVQQSPEKVAEMLNSLEFGQRANIFVAPAALHHGLFEFKRALESLGFEIIDMNGKEKQLVDWFTLSGGKRGYEVKFPHFDAVPLALEYTEDSLNDAILANRDVLGFRSRSQIPSLRLIFCYLKRTLLNQIIFPAHLFLLIFSSTLRLW
jgi:hypothetical protein